MQNNQISFTSFEKLLSYLIRFNVPIAAVVRLVVESSSGITFSFKILLEKKINAIIHEEKIFFFLKTY